MESIPEQAWSGGELDCGPHDPVTSHGQVDALVGTMHALRLADRLGYGRAFLASLTMSCGVPLLTPAMPWHAGALGAGLAALQFVACIGLGSANVLSTTLRQAVIPPGQLARTVGAYRAVNFGVIPIGSVLAAFLGVTFGSRVGVAVGTVGMAVSALPMLFSGVRKLERLDQVEPGARTTAAAV